MPDTTSDSLPCTTLELAMSRRQTIRRVGASHRRSGGAPRCKLLPLLALLLSLFAASCTNSVSLAPEGLQLQEMKPQQPNDIEREFTNSEYFFSEDDTFKRNPSNWLGRIGIVKAVGQSCVANTAQNQLTWEVGRLRASNAPDGNLGYAVDPPATNAELRGSLLITQNVAANVSALQYMEAQLAANEMYQAILTDLSTQRVQASAAFDSAVAAWTSSHRALLEDDSVCQVFLVEGYIHKTLAKKKLTKVSVSASGGVSGIKVGGEYYASNEQYELDHLFGLSPGFLKRTIYSAGGDQAAARSRATFPNRRERASAVELRALAVMRASKVVAESGL